MLALCALIASERELSQPPTPSRALSAERPEQAERKIRSARSARTHQSTFKIQSSDPLAKAREYHEKKDLDWARYYVELALEKNPDSKQAHELLNTLNTGRFQINYQF